MDILHGEEDEIPVRAHVVSPDHVAMIDPAHQLNFAQEALHQIFIFDIVRMQHFDRQLLVSENRVLCKVNSTHAAHTERL